MTATTDTVRVIPARLPGNYDRSLDDVASLADDAIVVRCYSDGTPLAATRPAVVGLDRITEIEWNRDAWFRVLYDPKAS